MKINVLLYVAALVFCAWQCAKAHGGPEEDARAALALSGAKAPKSNSDYTHWYGVLWKNDVGITLATGQGNGFYHVKFASADVDKAVQPFVDTGKVVSLTGKVEHNPHAYIEDFIAESVKEVEQAASHSTCDCGGDPTKCTCTDGVCRCPDCGLTKKSTAHVCFTGTLAAEYGEFVLLTKTDHYLLTLTPSQQDQCKALVMAVDKEVQICGQLDGAHSLVAESIKGHDYTKPKALRSVDDLPPGAVYWYRLPDGSRSPTYTKPGAPAPVQWFAPPADCVGGT